jgi:hypothetical protein
MTAYYIIAILSFISLFYFLNRMSINQTGCLRVNDLIPNFIVSLITAASWPFVILTFIAGAVVGGTLYLTSITWPKIPWRRIYNSLSNLMNKEVYCNK